MKNPFTGLFRARDKPKDSVSAAPTFFFGMSGSGKPWACMNPRMTAAGRPRSIRCIRSCTMSQTAR